MDPAPVGIKGDRALNVGATRRCALSPSEGRVGLSRLGTRLLGSDGGEVDKGREGGGAEHGKFGCEPGEDRRTVGWWWCRDLEETVFIRTKCLSEARTSSVGCEYGMHSGNLDIDPRIMHRGLGGSSGQGRAE